MTELIALTCLLGSCRLMPAPSHSAQTRLRYSGHCEEERGECASWVTCSLVSVSAQPVQELSGVISRLQGIPSLLIS
ncbi:hypothetical protein EOD39_16941 [Acipenser ruthenus]|uniref:Uncharacterized protein n=1 Tax=Acipenser ruthenus TaxID=7906 RepID=A0A444V4Q1_ACIRT|nr:hypothetical protein EOD39_16941 [Acipenser ruthenus]